MQTRFQVPVTKLIVGDRLHGKTDHHTRSRVNHPRKPEHWAYWDHDNGKDGEIWEVTEIRDHGEGRFSVDLVQVTKRTDRDYKGARAGWTKTRQVAADHVFDRVEIVGTPPAHERNDEWESAVSSRGLLIAKDRS